ncbi:MAG: carboxypeptidase regulatory-like domain-containing protein [Bacteroidota bacterium]
MKVIIKLVLTAIVLSLGISTATAQRKANKQYELKAFNLAIYSYLKYINQNPSSGEAMANLADCYRHINSMQEAVEWYERAFSAPQRIDPKHYLNYGKSLMGLGRYEQAGREFRRYAQIDPDLGNHFYEMAVFANRNMRVRSKFAIDPVKGLNTAASDFSPAFFRNNQLVYSSARTDVGKESENWAGKAKNQLLLAEYRPQSGTLEPVKLLHPSTSNRYSVGPVSYTADGRTVVITHNNFIDGTRHISSSGMKLDLYTSEAGFDGNWREEEEFPWNSSNFSTGFAHITGDGNSMYFASDRPGGLGGFDIYVSYRTGGSWSTPENLGPNINTAGDEITPYFDGRTLYFSSNWHNGYGGYDIFRSEGNNQQWGLARNMGMGINSARDDYGFIFDGIRNEGYFASNREGSTGGEDIFKISRQSNEITLKVINASDNRPVAQAVVDFSDCRRGMFETDVNGLFNFKADDELNCRVIIRKSGYSSSSLQLSALSVQNNKNYEVVLRREGESYRGLVSDVDTRIPMSDVRIEATNQRTGQISNAYTDQNGEYQLALMQGQNYTIRLSKMGYSDLNINVATRDGRDRSILGGISMRRVNSTTPIQDNRVTAGNTSNDRAININDLPTESYAVQVAATDKPNLNNYTALNVHGNVYFMNIGNMYRIRVGVFLDKADASTTLRKIRTEGYRDAFIVKEKTLDVSDKVLLDEGDYIATPDEVNRGGMPNDNTSSTGNLSGYKVQLAAYRNPQYFDESKVRDLGYVEQMQKGQFTVMLLSGFATAQEAKIAMQRAKSAGFSSAFVVLEENGEIRRVKI